MDGRLTCARGSCLVSQSSGKLILTVFGVEKKEIIISRAKYKIHFKPYAVFACTLWQVRHLSDVYLL